MNFKQSVRRFFSRPNGRKDYIDDSMAKIIFLWPLIYAVVLKRNLVKLSGMLIKRNLEFKFGHLFQLASHIVMSVLAFLDSGKITPLGCAWYYVVGGVLSCLIAIILNRVSAKIRRENPSALGQEVEDDWGFAYSALTYVLLRLVVSAIYTYYSQS